MNASELTTVVGYHERTKHRFDRYAASLGYMDWSNQPDPFRDYAGASTIRLPIPPARTLPSFDQVADGPPPGDSDDSPPGFDPIPRQGLDLSAVSRLFYFSLALSAWKRAPSGASWSLRVNPSSGALHPTEAYLIAGPAAGLDDRPTLFHYRPRDHHLELRCRFEESDWRALRGELPDDALFVALASIPWREAWKYGERSYRYCHHDAGHAVGALAYSARMLGWNALLLPGAPDRRLDQLCGLDRPVAAEPEHADCLLAVLTGEPPAPPARLEIARSWRLPADLSARLDARTWSGRPNQLSPTRHPWPILDEIAAATRRAEPLDWPLDADRWSTGAPTSGESTGRADRRLSAEQIVRQRRSAVDMDGLTSLDRPSFYRLLERTLPRPGRTPWDAWPWPARTSLVLFVHRVDGLAPGLYALPRSTDHERRWRSALRSDSLWRRPDDCPADLPLFQLLSGDARQVAQGSSCDQAIAADGVFAVAMLADFNASLDTLGPAAYPRLFWETGLIGQTLYLEAEAAGLRGTGIGCFFDDAVHDLLGLRDRAWQSLYHFTIGGPVDDPRLQTSPAYPAEPAPAP